MPLFDSFLAGLNSGKARGFKNRLNVLLRRYDPVKEGSGVKPLENFTEQAMKSS